MSCCRCCILNRRSRASLTNRKSATFFWLESMVRFLTIFLTSYSSCIQLLVKYFVSSMKQTAAVPVIVRILAKKDRNSNNADWWSWFPSCGCCFRWSQLEESVRGRGTIHGQIFLPFARDSDIRERKSVSDWQHRKSQFAVYYHSS